MNDTTTTEPLHLANEITNSDFICLLQDCPSTDQEEVFNEAARRIQKLEALILSLEKKLSEALSAYAEASLVAEKAACRWEEIRDSLRSRGCNI
jgi:hypothetical protein